MKGQREVSHRIRRASTTRISAITSDQESRLLRAPLNHKLLPMLTEASKESAHCKIVSLANWFSFLFMTNFSKSNFNSFFFSVSPPSKFFTHIHFFYTSIPQLSYFLMSIIRFRQFYNWFLISETYYSVKFISFQSSLSSSFWINVFPSIYIHLASSIFESNLVNYCFN